MRGEHRLGVARGEVLAVLRRPGLHDERSRLRRARRRERAVHGEVRPRVRRGVDLRRVRPHAGVLVREHGVVLPRVPELERDVEELRRALVADRVGGLVVEAEVARDVRACRRHDVPPRPAAGDVVDRREPPREVVRRVVRRRRRRDEADPLGHRRDGGEDDERVERPRRAAPDVGPQPRAVREEDRVEPARLRDLREALQVRDVRRRPRRVALRQPPRRLVVARAHEERVEVQAPGAVACGGVAGHAAVSFLSSRTTPSASSSSVRSREKRGSAGSRASPGR